MKTLVIASVLGVASSLFNAAHAGFNDRGEDFIAYVKSDPNVRRPSVAVVASGFNDRGHDDTIRTHASTGPNSQRHGNPRGSKPTPWMNPPLTPSITSISRP